MLLSGLVGEKEHTCSTNDQFKSGILQMEPENDRVIQKNRKELQEDMQSLHKDRNFSGWGNDSYICHHMGVIRGQALI